MPQRPILVVNDNPVDQLVTGTLLESAGHHVVYANDGLQALQQAAELDPALIVTDIDMPGMNGIEATKRIRSLCTREHKPVPPVIGRSAMMDASREAQCLEAGMTRAFSKPVDFQLLLTTVAELLTASSKGRA